MADSDEVGSEVDLGGWEGEKSSGEEGVLESCKRREQERKHSRNHLSCCLQRNFYLSCTWDGDMMIPYHSVPVIMG